MNKNIFKYNDLIQCIFLNLETYEDFKNLSLVSKRCYVVSKIIKQNFKINTSISLCVDYNTGWDSCGIDVIGYEDFKTLKEAIFNYNKHKSFELLFNTDEDSEYDPLYICSRYCIYDKNIEDKIYDERYNKTFDRNSMVYLYYGYPKEQSYIKETNIKNLCSSSCCNNLQNINNNIVYTCYDDDIHLLHVYSGCLFSKLPDKNKNDFTHVQHYFEKRDVKQKPILNIGFCFNIPHEI